MQTVQNNAADQGAGVPMGMFRNRFGPSELAEVAHEPAFVWRLPSSGEMHA